MCYQNKGTDQTLGNKRTIQERLQPLKEMKSATRHKTSGNSSGVLPLPGNQSRMEKEKGVRFWQDHETREDSLLYITKWKVLGGNTGHFGT